MDILIYVEEKIVEKFFIHRPTEITATYYVRIFTEVPNKNFYKCRFYCTTKAH